MCILRSVLYISALEIHVIMENIVSVFTEKCFYISALEIILENIVSVCTEKCALHFSSTDTCNHGEHCESVY